MNGASDPAYDWRACRRVEDGTMSQVGGLFFIALRRATPFLLVGDHEQAKRVEWWSIGDSNS